MVSWVWNLHLYHKYKPTIPLINANHIPRKPTIWAFGYNFLDLKNLKQENTCKKIYSCGLNGIKITVLGLNRIFWFTVNKVEPGKVVFAALVHLNICCHVYCIARSTANESNRIGCQRVPNDVMIKLACDIKFGSSMNVLLKISVLKSTGQTKHLHSSVCGYYVIFTRRVLLS